MSEFPRDSAVYAEWSTIPKNYRSTEGRDRSSRRVMVLTARGTSLVPWRGPKADLEAACPLCGAAAGETCRPGCILIPCAECGAARGCRCAWACTARPDGVRSE